MKKGDTPNAFKVLVCDPDDNQVEGSALGLLYAATSRASTLGDDTGLNSGIYFTGDNFTSERICQLGKKKPRTKSEHSNPVDYEKVKKRKLWVSYLIRNTRDSTMSNEEMESLHKWTKRRIQLQTLEETIRHYFENRSDVHTRYAFV